MDKNRWILLLAALLIVAVIFLILISKREKKPVNKRSIGQPKEPTPVAASNNTLESLKEECWRSYVAYCNTEKKLTLYREVFCNDGILLYLQRLIGFCRYDMGEFGEVEQFKLKAGMQLLGGLFGCINAKMPYNGTTFVVPREFHCDTTKEAYLFNIGINTDTVASKEATINKLRDKIAARHKDTAELISNSNNNFYEALWNNSIGGLEALSAFYKRELQDSKDLPFLKEKLTKLVREAQEKLTGSGIRFAFYESLPEEEKEKLFLLLGSVDEVPAVLRRKDGFLYYKGKLTEKRAVKL